MLRSPFLIARHMKSGPSGQQWSQIRNNILDCFS